MKFVDPQAVIEKLSLQEGMAVADFGCGTGYFSMPIAKKIGKDGVVYALDILSDKLEVIASRAKIEGTTNVITKKVNLENPNGSSLPAESVDRVILKDVLFQNKNKEVILEEAKRVLKPGGKALVVEWKKTDTPIGPEKGVRISREGVEAMAKKGGWKNISEIEAGDFHFGFILQK